jgi:hypothetical protein
MNLGRHERIVVEVVVEEQRRIKRGWIVSDLVLIGCPEWLLHWKVDLVELPFQRSLSQATSLRASFALVEQVLLSVEVS